MAILGFGKPDPVREITKTGIEISTCDFDCGSCENPLPSSLKIRGDDDEGEPLWKQGKVTYDVHFLVSTGRNDWQKEATDEEGSLGNAVAAWRGNGRNPKVSCSSFPANNGEVLIMPFFVWVKNVTPENIKNVLDKVVPELYNCREQKEKLVETDDVLDDDLNVKLEIDNMDSYIFLCSHKTRDKRCGVSAPYMKKEFELYIRDDGKYRDVGDATSNGIVVGFVSHLHNHKYAANVLVYRRQGEIIWLGRATPNNVGPIYKECVIAGRTFAEYSRIVKKEEAIKW